MPARLETNDGGAYVVRVGDETHEVELPEGFADPTTLREKYVPKDFMESEITRRLKSATKGMRKPEELLGDDSFLDQVVESHRDTLVKRLGVKASDPAELERAQQAWRDRELKPVQGQLEELNTELQQIRRQNRDALVVTAVKEVAAEEVEPLLADHLRSRMQWDDESRGWFIVGEDGEFRSTTEPKAGKAPYMTADEYLEELRRSGKHKAWFRDQSRSGAGYRGAGGGRGGQVTLEAFQKMSGPDRRKLYAENPDLYRQLMAEHQAAGETQLLRDR